MRAGVAWQCAAAENECECMQCTGQLSTVARTDQQPASPSSVPRAASNVPWVTAPTTRFGTPWQLARDAVGRATVR